MAMYNRLEWQRRTNEEKAESVCRALSLPTHNGFTKADLIMMLDWCFHQLYECDKPCGAYQERCECLRILKGGAECL